MIPVLAQTRSLPRVDTPSSILPLKGEEGGPPPPAGGRVKSSRSLRGQFLTIAGNKTSADTHTWTWSEDEIWRGGSLLAYQSSTGVRHIGLDHLGSTVMLTDSNGHLIGNVSYDPFGSGGATGAGMLQYTGHERDAATVGPQAGTARLPDYLHARYYDPNGGRFLSVDQHSGAPHDPRSWNRYAYARNNPMKYRDPDGEDIQLAGEYSNEVFRMLVLTAEHPQGRADIATLANNHNLMVTYHDERINTVTRVAQLLHSTSPQMVKLALSTANKLPNATTVDVAIDTLAVSILHPDPTGVVTVAHEDFHGLGMMNGLTSQQIQAQDSTGSAEAYGRSVAASPTDMSETQAETFVSSLLLPAEPPIRLTDIQPPEQ